MKYGFGEPPSGYTSTWWFYDNQKNKPREKIEGPATHADTFVELPRALEEVPSGTYCFVEISPTDDAPVNWQKSVRVFFRKADMEMEIVGIYREESTELWSELTN